MTVYIKIYTYECDECGKEIDSEDDWFPPGWREVTPSVHMRTQHVCSDECEKKYKEDI